MKGFIDSVFKLISQVRVINKQKLIITNKDTDLFYKSYMDNKLHKVLTYNKWKNCIINYSIENCVDFDESIKYFIDYKNNNMMVG